MIESIMRHRGCEKSCKHLYLEHRLSTLPTISQNVFSIINIEKDINVDNR